MIKFENINQNAISKLIIYRSLNVKGLMDLKSRVILYTVPEYVLGIYTCPT